MLMFVLGSLFCSIELCVCFYANTICSDYYSLYYGLKSGCVMLPALFFLKIALAVQGLL